ncbi:nephrin-like isoform X3 [Leptopilina heterotoma]|uniref:nephrin-like isoform X3 n=1 Tax=Leptopilina heterotoma TaxID=63436 RepID=UPI001CA7C842|nr:nephrin-like isoform X3 [Leptopilina heterotoma]
MEGQIGSRAVVMLKMKLLLLVVFCTTPVVKVAGAAQSFRIRPSNNSVSEGRDVLLNCAVDNRVGIVQWAKDGFAFVVQQNGEIVGYPRLRLVGEPNNGIYNLKITNASLSDDGEYQCQVGPFLRAKAIRANAHLNVISPPQIVEISSHPHLDKIEIKAGDKLTLECAVRMAKPAATIIWYRENVAIKGGDINVDPIPVSDDKEILKDQGNKKKPMKFDTTGSLTIVTTPEDDGMSYTCEARHPAIGIERPMRATVKLSVFYPPEPPQIEGYTEGETLRRGQQVELVCKSRGGNPPAQVVWFRNGEQINSAYRTEGRTSQNIQTFLAQAQDNKARYTCEVSNIMSVQPMKAHVDLTVLFAPSGVKISGPTEAKAEEKVVITCTTENSNPTAEIKWTIDKHIILNMTSKTEIAPEGGFITSSNVTFAINKAAQKVVAICQALNQKLTETIVGTHTINVIYPPSHLRITGYEEGTTIQAGNVLKLACSVTSGNPPPTITWYKNEKKVQDTIRHHEHIVTSELALVINASDNNAHIKCEAVNSATTYPMSQKLILKVLFPPDKVKITTDPRSFEAGGSGKLICESSSSNPAAEMSWWMAGIPVEGTENSTKPGLHGGYVSIVTLPLDFKESMNNNVYTCQARNAAMERSIHDAVTLNILYKPIFTNPEPSELIGMENEPYIITLQTRGNPGKITYTWTRDGLHLPDRGRRMTARGPTLNITKLERLDSGSYVCEAINDKGATFYHLNLTVQYPAKITRTSTSGVIYPPEKEAKLFCEVDGSPMGEEYITWYKAGTSIEVLGKYSLSYVNKTSFLHIENPGRDDVGEYQCNVNNGIGNVTSSPILFITNFIPEMANSPLTRKAAAVRGVNAQLFCKARGSPLPEFSWFFNGKPLLPNLTEYKYGFTSSNLSELYSQSVLTVNRVTSEDYGKYECQARNKMGMNKELIQLDVTSPPDQPSDLEIYNVTHDSVMLIWKRGFDGGLPTSHQIRWRQALDYENRYHYLDVSPGDYKALITGLSLGTYYVFSIKAMNSKGESAFLPDLVKVQTLRPNNAENVPEVLLERSDIPLNYIYTVAATSIVFFIINLFVMLWYIVRKRNKTRINKSHTADMYAPSTVNGDTITGELSSVSDEKSDVNFDANDYVDEGRKTAASTYLIDSGIQDYGKSSLEMQVHHQGTLSRRNHVPSVMNMDSPPQRTTASGTLSASKSSYIGNPSPAPPSEVNFYSVEMDNGLFMGYEVDSSPGPMMGDPGPGAYYPSLGSVGHMGPLTTVMPGTGTLNRNRTLPRPVPPPDVTVMTAGIKSQLPPSVPPPPATFARAAHIPVNSHGHPLSTFTSTPTYSDIDGHLV